MSRAITINLPDETKAALDDAVRKEGLSQNELVDKALKDFLFVRQFRSVREKVLAQPPETYTDQDVFEQVS